MAARALLASPDAGMSAQVLQEFYAVAVAKKRLRMSHDEALAVLQSLADFPVCPITRELVMEAVALRQRFQIGRFRSDGCRSRRPPRRRRTHQQSNRKCSRAPRWAAHSTMSPNYVQIMTAFANSLESADARR